MATQITNKAWLKGKNGGQGIDLVNYSNEVVATVAEQIFALTKTESADIVTHGSVITYTIACVNMTATAQPMWEFVDAIPIGTTYVPGSFTMDGTVVTPVISGAYLTYQIPSWGVGVTHTFTFQSTVV